MSEALAERLRGALAKRRGVTEKRMFGGVCFLLNGNMICGSTKSDFMFRVGRAKEAEALARKGARPMDLFQPACQSKFLRIWDFTFTDGNQLW